MNQARTTAMNTTGSNTTHWYEDMAGNAVAIGAAVAALLITFQPNISVFSPLGVAGAETACSESPACKAIQVEGPSSMFDMHWTIWVVPSGQGTQADRLALRDAVFRAAIRDPDHASVVLGAMPAKSKKGA